MTTHSRALVIQHRTRLSCTSRGKPCPTAVHGAGFKPFPRLSLHHECVALNGGVSLADPVAPSCTTSRGLWACLFVLLSTSCYWFLRWTKPSSTCTESVIDLTNKGRSINDIKCHGLIIEYTSRENSLGRFLAVSFRGPYPPSVAYTHLHTSSFFLAPKRLAQTQTASPRISFFLSSPLQ